MLTKNDVLLILTDLEAKGINVDEQTSSLLKSSGISKDVIRFINEKRQFDVAAFYDRVRKNYNQKKSKLYKNLVKENIENPEDLLTTLGALNLQILLFAKKLPDDKLFLKHVRAKELADALVAYYASYDLLPSIKLLKLIKIDLKMFEEL